jgi:hypothetical protein
MLKITEVEEANGSFVKKVTISELADILSLEFSYATHGIDDMVVEFLGHLTLNIEKGTEDFIYNRSENILIINNVSLQYVDGYKSIELLADHGIKVHPESFVLLTIHNERREDLIY